MIPKRLDRFQDRRRRGGEGWKLRRAREIQQRDRAEHCPVEGAGGTKKGSEVGDDPAQHVEEVYGLVGGECPGDILGELGVEVVVFDKVFLPLRG